ncbi:MAG: tetratricopeptide repeat protein [Desulfosarcinaceae bacterium]|nr:tetratricopeptide repeat protein [Desulfosarcinaceae bacterium]
MASTRETSDQFTKGMEAFVKGDFDMSESLFTKILSVTPDHKQALVSRGAARLKNERTRVALEDFNRAIELDASNARVFHLRGLAHEKQGNQTAAIEDFSRAVEINPEYGAAYFSRATLYNKMGRGEDAASDMQVVAHMTHKNITEFANDNNLIHSEHLRLEDALETELNR